MDRLWYGAKKIPKKGFPNYFLCGNPEKPNQIMFSYTFLCDSIIENIPINLNRLPVLKKDTIRAKSNHPNIKYEILIDSFHGITLSYYDKTRYFNNSSIYELYLNDRVEIIYNGKKHKIDSLIYGNSYTKYHPINSGVPTHRSGITSAFYLYFNNSKYLLLYAGFSTGTQSYPGLKALLFKLDNKIEFYSLPPEAQQSSPCPACFSDFNKDGVLDYILYHFNIDKMPILYTLRDNVFKKDTSVEFYIEDGPLFCAYIDTIKSKWTGKYYYMEN